MTVRSLEDVARAHAATEALSETIGKLVVTVSHLTGALEALSEALERSERRVQELRALVGGA